MRRLPTFPKLLALVCLLLALTACEPGNAPLELSLAELAAQPAAYDGRIVRVRGTVKGFHDPRHYWLEDEQLNRVGLIPEDRIAPHLGRQVTVLGQFSYSRERGRRLRVGTVESFDAVR